MKEQAETYKYEVIASLSKDFPIGMKFDTETKMHDGRKKETQLVDKDFNIFIIKVRKKE